MAHARRECEQLMELVRGIHYLVGTLLPITKGIVIMRRVAMDCFKSRAVLDIVKIHELMDQAVFNPQSRLLLQLRFLSSASTRLARDFSRSSSEGAITFDCSDELWIRLGSCFHDFDLIAMETLLIFMTFLACQSPEQAHEIETDIRMRLAFTRHVSTRQIAG